MGLFDRWQKKEREKNQRGGAKAPAALKTAPEEKIEPAAINDQRPTAGRKVSMSASRVIIKPAVTEKAAVAESANKYTFFVSRQATKKQIKSAINEIYGIMPIAVNLINVEGKTVRYGRFSGRRSDFKKALVTLPQGKTISVHEGV